MVSKIVGMVATSRKENVPGVAQMVGAVEKIGLEMDAMVILVGQIIINAYLKQVCILLFDLGSYYTYWSYYAYCSNFWWVVLFIFITALLFLS